MPELLDILLQLYGTAWMFVAAAVLVDDLLAARRAKLAASDALLDNVGSALPVAEQLDDLGARFVRWRQEEIENRPMPAINPFIGKEDRA
ncbi:MAG: hypothetical protein HOQ21_09915 [Dermatophilaceae bacterium]|nr:hypothetical protein [Dermatophilaceae bacterium]